METEPPSPNQSKAMDETLWLHLAQDENLASPKAAQPGQPCPRCHQGIMDYDGLLNLVCPVCHYVEGGGCT